MNTDIVCVIYYNSIIGDVAQDNQVFAFFSDGNLYTLCVRFKPRRFLTLNCNILF